MRINSKATPHRPDVPKDYPGAEELVTEDCLGPIPVNQAFSQQVKERK
jgi:hypothetical protein